MIQVLLLTRGGLALEWLRATEAVRCCKTPGIEALTLGWESTEKEDRAHVRKRIFSIREDGPVLVLTDLHGSTQSNLAAELSQDREVAVVAGANLAMVLRLACDDREDRSLDELAEWICAKGQAAITRIGAQPAPGTS